MTKDELLDHLRIERASWYALLDDVGVERMLVPGVVDAWSVKDAVAHVNFWDRFETRQMAAAIDRREPSGDVGCWRFPPEMSENITIQRTQEIVIETSRELPAEYLVTEARQIFDEFVCWLEHIREDDIRAVIGWRTTPPRGENRLWAREGEEPVSQPKPFHEHASLWTHWREHAEPIGRWVREPG